MRVQEVEVDRFKDNRHMKVVRLSALRTGCFNPQEIYIPGTHFCQRLSRPKCLSAVGRIMSMKNSSDTTLKIGTRDLPACSTLPQPTVPPCTACYFVSTDMFPYLYISKQSISLLTDFSYRCVSQAVYLLLKFCTAANVLTLLFIANNSRHVAHSRVQKSGFSYRLSRSTLFIEDNFILTGVPDRCDNHEAWHYASLLRPLWSK